jgi:SNF2 family DNA or RNA helicase
MKDDPQDPLTKASYAQMAKETMAQYQHAKKHGFKAEFCEIGYFNEIKGYKNLDELRRRIDGHCYRVLADDCMDLPERVYKEWPFDLAENERRVFDELNGHNLAYFARLESQENTDASARSALESVEDTFETPDSGSLSPETIEEHSAMVKNLRLQQISSGWWPSDDVKALESDGPSRLKALLSLLQAHPGKALIFARFRADLHAIADALGNKAVSYHGGVNEEDRATAKRRFMEDDKIQYFIGQPRSAGIGHTLTAAKHVIFYSNDPSLRLREECEKRAHRKGLKHKLMVWDLKARRTQDHKIITAFRWKKDLANLIMQDPDNFFLKYEE